MQIPIVLKRLVPLSFMLCLTFWHMAVAHAETLSYGRWSEVELTQIVTSKKSQKTPGSQIVEISNYFVDTPYAANTLIGSPRETEQLVLDLEKFDCFTLLDTVEAFRRADDVQDIPESLSDVRYYGGVISYTNRRHFFSDWVNGDTGVSDVTVLVGQGAAQTVNKLLNRKSDGSFWVPGVTGRARSIHYIPTGRIDKKILSALLPGDYIGIYTNMDGLDVTHTGLIVVDEGKVMIRHASSRSDVARVVDEDLVKYLQNKPGLVVYRVAP